MVIKQQDHKALLLEHHNKKALMNLQLLLTECNWAWQREPDGLY